MTPARALPALLLAAVALVPRVAAGGGRGGPWPAAARPRRHRRRPAIRARLVGHRGPQPPLRQRRVRAEPRAQRPARVHASSSSPPPRCWTPSAPTRGSAPPSRPRAGSTAWAGSSETSISSAAAIPTCPAASPTDRPTAAFEEMAEALRQQGVRRIEGRIVGHEGLFTGDRRGDDWTWGDLVWGYGAEVSALSFNDNVAVVTVSPGEREGDPIVVDRVPVSAYYTRDLHRGDGAARRRPRADPEAGLRLEPRPPLRRRGRRLRAPEPHRRHRGPGALRRHRVRGGPGREGDPGHLGRGHRARSRCRRACACWPPTTASRWRRSSRS